MSSDVDVVVVGAGVSGLTAAMMLQGAGRDVRILEASTRSGGRAFSPILGADPIDLGATWVWQTESAVLTLLDQLGIERFPDHGDGIDTYDGPEGLQRGRLPRSAVPEFRIRGGVGRLPSLLAERVRPELARPVRALVEQGDRVEVQLDEERFMANHVLVAVPPRLVARRIEIPGAPVDVWRRVPTWMAEVAKVVAVFDARHWVESGWSGRAMSQQGPMVEVRDMSGPEGSPAVMMGFVPRANAGEGLETRVREQFCRLFGVGMHAKLLHIQKWWEQEWTRGSDTDPDEMRLFGHPILQKPFLGQKGWLISCETSARSPGHLNGAIERAQSVAGSI